MIIAELARRCGFNGILKKGRFGIEIETETKKPSCYPTGFLEANGADEEGHSIFKVQKLPSWIAKTDGSLRNYGIEYIFSTPYSYTRTLENLGEFQEGTRGIAFLEDQPSTSVHVHINFGGETLITLANFITMWTLFENILVDYSGPMRRSNLFALSARLAEQQVYDYVKLFKGLEAGLHGVILFNQQSVKYAALNLGCLARLGSLEVRCFRGTTNTDDISNWISILNRMFEFSKTPGLTPSGFFTSYHEKGVEIISDVFGPYSNSLKCDGFIEMMERQEKFLFDMVTSVKNWQTFGLIFEELQKPKTNLSKAAMKLEQMQQYQSIMGSLVDLPMTAAEMHTLQQMAGHGHLTSPGDMWTDSVPTYDPSIDDDDF